MKNSNDNRERVISILSGIDRPGMQDVIEKLDEKGYFRAMCYGHHRYVGGMKDHALEVYDYMMENAPAGMNRDSIAIVALFHDFGKAVHKSKKYNGNHPLRSVILLEELGLELTRDEHLAISMHHEWKSAEALWVLATCPLRRLLSSGDCHSTGEWKKAHENKARN